MLCLKSASRMCLRQSGYRNHGLGQIFTECSRLRKARTRCFHNIRKTLISSMSNYSSSLSCLKSGNRISCKRIMGQASVIKSDREHNSYFQQLLHSRKKQAQQSVLLEITKKEDIPYAIALCQSFGSIASAYSYDGESSNCFILLEFTDEGIAQNLLLNCHCKNTSDAFPISSRLIKFDRKLHTCLPKVNIDILEANKEKSPVKENSISGLIEDMYSSEKLSEFSIKMRFFFCILIRDSLSGLFPYCDVLPFGSSVNGIGKQGCDLDVMIRLYPEEGPNNSELYFLNKTCIGDVKALQQRTISCIGDILRTFFPGVVHVQKILHARMPIIKLEHRLLKMHCDISINNVSAVLMSEIVHFCGEIDFRVRPLLHAVKKWAKLSNITYENPGTWITNFGLTTLVLYFLQKRPNAILPPFSDALVIVGEDTSPGFRIEYLKSLEELKSCASANEESLDILLKEFFIFLGTYSFKECIISLMSGKSISRNNGTPLWVQYPFEEDLNVTKNVSEYEFSDMCEKASAAAKHLENSINRNVYFKDLGAAFGIQKPDPSKSKKNSKRIDVSEFLNDPPKGAKQKPVRHGIS